MIHAALPLLLVAGLFGVGLYGVLARRNAVLMIIGVEIMLAAVGLLLVTVDATIGQKLPQVGEVATLFIITMAAAETVVAIGVVVAVFRARGSIDLTVSAREAAPDQQPAEGGQR